MLCVISSNKCQKLQNPKAYIDIKNMYLYKQGLVSL